MNKETGWGIMGSGNMAREFAAALTHVEDAKLIAIGSRSHDQAQTFAAQYSVPNIHPSYAALAEDPQVDVVYIATPHSMHKDNAILALQANKHVLCEKPFAINAQEAGNMIALARDKNLFLMEAMWTRFLPAVAKLKALLRDQAIGEIQMMLAGGAYVPDTQSPSYLLDPELGGGVLLDAGIYLVSMASYVFGQADSVLAMGQLSETGVDEHEAILLGHSNGAIANLYVSLRGKASPDLTLIGNKGKIYVHPPFFAPVK